MVQVGSKTMIQWIVDALTASKTIGRITAVGDVEASGIDQVVKPGTGFLENLMLGIDKSGATDRVLVLTCDIPMLTPEAVDDYVERALESGGEMCYPIVTRASNDAKYPGMKRTYLKTAEGMFTGGNMMVLGVDLMRRNRDMIQGAYESRKNPLALAWMIGIGFLLRLILAQVQFPSVLPINVLERRLSKVLKGKVVAIKTDYPEIGADVDKASDLEAVRKVLGQSVARTKD
jgi:GTP:adenosylcobinamide-phosphate guanylyltransferase